MFHRKQLEADGGIIEIKIWRVPVSKIKPEGIKYSLVYIVSGKRLAGYDNAEGKGHHRHYKGKETSYIFQSIGRLFADFQKDIRRIKKSAMGGKL
ncbi:MAG: hypothetical protein IEMM0002_1458 [bacterium]|nr:MAG: hypothetical protein IEMM0002_1458 [bacterium]